MTERPTPSIDFASLPQVPDGNSYSAELWIAWAHLRSKKSEAFVNLVTIFAILGVVVGVAVLNIVISVMTGFEVDLRDKILGANAHIVVLRSGAAIDDAPAALDKITAVPGVTAAAPFLYQEMMIRSSVAHTGVIFKGVDPDRTGDVTHLRDDLYIGIDGPLRDAEARARNFDAIRAPVAPPEVLTFLHREEGREPVTLPGIFLGKDLLETLATFPGDTVTVINPVGGGVGPMGMPTPSFRNFRVLGAFDSGMYEYNTKWTYVANDDARSFLKVNGVHGIEVKVKDIDDVERISKDIEASLGHPYIAKHWKTLNQKLFEALALEKWVMGLILGMIVVVAGLLIVTTLFMLVITKGREIAILEAMGASPAAILRIFILQGSFIGFVGTIAGTVLGLAGCSFLKVYGYPLETDVYYLSELPVVVDPSNVVLIAVVAFLVCFICTIYPAARAASLDPVEGLRYE